MRSLWRVLLTLTFAAAASAAMAQVKLPTSDVPGSADNPLAKRYEGSLIVSFEKQAYTDFKIPLSKLVRNKENERDAKHNNYIFVADKSLELEGALTRAAYLIPADRSPLEVLRNYQDVVKAAGGETLYECKTADCGGDQRRSSSGGGGEQSFIMYFFHESDLKDKPTSAGYCALTVNPTDQRFFAGKIPQPDGETYVTVQTFQLLDSRDCLAFKGRTIAVVHVLEPKARERKMVVVKAEEMAKGLDATGRIALYGIYFDTDKTDIKPESGETLQQIAALMKGDPKLEVIIVGHTDNQGKFDYNLDLSTRRANAVAQALASQYGVAKARVRASGVGMLAPVASNESEDGRAKNRRVELVKLN